MNPEDLLRRFNDPAEWNARLSPRTDAFPARRRMSPWLVSLATVAAIAIVVTVIFASFGLSVRSLRPKPVPPALTSQTPTPVPTDTPSALPTVPATPPSVVVRPSETDQPIGDPVTCDNLLGTSVIDQLTGAGFVLKPYVNDGQTQIATAPGSGLPDFEKSGTICFVTTPIQGDDAATVDGAYAFRAVSADEESAAKAKLTKVAKPISKAVEQYTSAADATASFGFAGGYEIYSYDNSGEDQLFPVLVARLAQKTSVDAAKPATPASPPYLTSEGLGDLRIGQKIPSNSAIATYSYLSYCKADRWKPAAKYNENAFDVLTTDRSRDAKLYAIILRDDTIPTKSGIRVGDSLATLLATYPKFDAIETGGEGTNYIISGTAGQVVFAVFSFSEGSYIKANTVAAISLFPSSVKPKDLGDVFHTDAVSPCGAA